MVGSIISFHEYNELIKKAFRKKNYLIFFFQITNFLFFITFLIVGYSMYDFPPTSLIFIILICIFSDTGGYFIGKLIGGKKINKN